MLRDAYTFIVPLGIIAIVLLLMGWAIWPEFYYPGVIVVLLAGFVAFFFRDPEREVPAGEGLVVSPADGVVKVVREREGAGGGRETLVSIFLSVLDVHVNRSPIGGRIVDVDYRPGKFLVANIERASIENEQNVVTVEGRYARIVFKQIAGLIARRIVFWKKPGESVSTGERVGLIRFGSRVDVIMPEQVIVEVRKGDRVKGGISVIGRIQV